jgi:hypothetical protein
MNTINTSQLAASSTENLIEDEPQLMTSTTGYSFMSIDYCLAAVPAADVRHS